MGRAFVLIFFLLSSQCAAQTAPAFIRAWGAQSGGDAVFLGPTSVAVSPTGFVYARDAMGIRKFDRDGQFLQFLDFWVMGWPEFMTDTAGLSISPSNHLYWTAMSVQGHGYVGCDTTGAITDGNEVCCAACAECEACMPYGDAVNIDAHTSRGLYVIDSRWANVCGPTVLAGVSGIGIAVDAAGSVFVTNGRVHKFEVDGSFVTSWSGSPEGGELSNPTAIAVDAAGHVYVVDAGNNRIQVFTNDGHFLATCGTPGSGPGQFNDPQSIALDAQGNIYVADIGNQRIQKFGPYVGVERRTWSDLRAMYR